jgi:hypothetical protein
LIRALAARRSCPSLVSGPDPVAASDARARIESFFAAYLVTGASTGPAE